jgi:superfamily II DNA/RNA helicase
VDDVSLVVHVDPPAEHKAYLHRSGRTARAGAGGVVVTLTLPEQAAAVRQLARAARITPTTTTVGPGHPLLRSLAGASPQPVVVPDRPASAPGAPRGRRRSRSRSRR